MLFRYKLDNERFCGFKLVQYEVEKSLVCTILSLLFLTLLKWCWMCIVITALVSIVYSKSEAHSNAIVHCTFKFFAA